MPSTNVSRSKRTSNETVQIDVYNQAIPSYLYKEIPGCLEVAGMFLNVTMVIYFIKSKRYKSPLFTILTSLAIMDTYACFGAFMHILTLPTVIVPAAGFVCALREFVSTIGLIGSEYHLVLFAGLRLYQVMSPLKARASVTVSVMVKFCVIIVALTMCCAIVDGLYARSSTTVINGEQVIVCISFGDDYPKAIAMAYLFIGTIIPCVSIILIHVLKYFAYVRSKSLIDSLKERKSPDARVLVIVIALFYTCMAPLMIYTLVQLYTIENYDSDNDYLGYVLAHVMFSNSIMNPLVYVLAMKSIRDEVINLFCFKTKIRSI